MSWPPDPHAVGLPVEELDTPCLVLDLDAVERNMDAMARAFAATPVALRPHAKTHKTPALALMQLQRGAVGVCCAKIGEAEVMAAGGVSDILVTTEVVGTAKIRRLLGLARQVRVITVVDDTHAAQQVAEAAQEAELTIPCLVDIDVGTNRTGVAPGEPALALAERVARMPGLQFMGLQGYEGHLQHLVDVEERRAAHGRAMGLLSETAKTMRDRGLPVEVVSTAGTGTAGFAGMWPAVTEVQPGSYIVMDTDYGRVQGLGFEPALGVLTTVVSKRANGVVVDAGLKALSTDSGPARPRVFDAAYAPRGDEHGMITFEAGNPLAIGDKFMLLPSHCDTTINLHDLYYVQRGGWVVAVWPIAARGRLQ